MMFILYFLLTNAAVLIGGASITQYGNFENLDTLSLCQNGVLAMDKEGTIWVIYNNGNWTYNMTWHEYGAKWETHRIKMSDWNHSVNGTTIGASIEAKYTFDQFMDTCYGAWDAVVGYISGGNDILWAPGQKCPSNKKFCGDDPEAEAIGMTIPFTQPQKLLISCGGDGSIARVDICDRNCTSRRDNPGNGHCECSPNQFYCGHQLHSLDWDPDYDNDTLYFCLDGINVFRIKRCSSGCLARGLGSVCSGNCDPNKTFCGHKLIEMGLIGYDPNAVYRCSASGRSAHIIANCSEDCEQADSENAMCQCHPGRTYCVHELYAQMNWWMAADIFATFPHQTGQCLPDKLTVSFGFTCTICVASHSEKDAYCQWTPGAFCGRRLNKIGFKGYDNDTFYQCGEEERNTSIISMCLKGTCLEDYCSCIPLRTYCGYQLYLMGWPIPSEGGLGDLWQCETDGIHARMISQCRRRCTNVEGRAKCACMDTEFYCGYELDADPPYDDNNIHQCQNDGIASITRTCNGSCIRVREANSLAVSVPDCLGECIPGEAYCGSKLFPLGYTGLNSNSIYTCSKDGRTVIDTGQVDILCLRCMFGRSYCGHQLSRSMHISQKSLNTRYLCQDNGTLADTAICTKCINNSAGAYCDCSPDAQYCGDKIQPAGWQEFVEISNFTYDTLIRCVRRDFLEVLDQCSKGECRTIGSGISYCMCTPGRSYCGHQLDTHYNSPNIALSSHNIYQCSDNQLWVDAIKECGTCVSINGNPICRQQCIQGSRYCGSDLLHLEGWDNLDIEPVALYQCTNGSFASLEINCTQGCHAKNGDADAYCLGMPMAWYWIFMAVTLPLLFVSLCFWLIRTIRKQRDLQKFIQQHRINGRQLTRVKKLGQGHFGEVWKMRYIDTSGQQLDVAVKISKQNRNPDLNLASASCFVQESVALDFLRHHNIIKFLGICPNLKMAGGITTPALVLEYMDGGNSADYVLKEREHLVTSDLMHIFIDICQAGEHLQKMGVIHRDIGARNVLIRKHPRNGKPAVAKLTDFGLAKDIGKNTTLYKSINAPFHEGYTAPEGFKGEFSSQSDVWSFGVFMWELYMLMDRNQTEPVEPYSDIPSQDILIELGNGYRLRRPLKAPTDIYSKMTNCWAWTPESRPTFCQLRKTLHAKRTHNGVEWEPNIAGHVAGGGENTFLEDTATNDDGYVSPR